MRTAVWMGLALWLTVGLVACSDDNDNKTDTGGVDVSSDAGTETGPDAVVDTTPDAVPDAVPDTGGGSGVETSHGGLNLTQWMTAYVTWALGGSEVERIQDRVFLPLPDSTDPDEDGIYSGEIDVTLAATDGFVLPTLVWIGERYDDDTEDERDFPSREDFLGTELVVTLNGVTLIDSSVDDLGIYFFEGDFEPAIEYDEPSDYGSVAAVWLRGLGFLHGPLSPGVHVLHLEELNEEIAGYSNTWNITVE
jgi:hypothetical protein